MFLMLQNVKIHLIFLPTAFLILTASFYLWAQPAGTSMGIQTSQLAVQPAGSEQEKELFLIAQRAFDDGFYDVAMRYIDQFLREYPQSDKKVQAGILLGQCYFFKNQYLKAFDIFQPLLQSSEFKDATLFWLGETYLKGSDYSKAEKQYRQILEVYPDSPYAPQAYYSLGWAYFDQKEYQSARDIFIQLVKKFPLHQLAEDGMFKVGESEYNLHGYDNAIQYFQDYIFKNPKSPRHDQAYFYTAESYYYSGKFTEAVDYYAKVIEISTDSKLVVMAKVSTGWSHLKQKNYEPSQKAFEEAQTFAKQKGILSDDIYLGLANLYSEMGQNDKSLQAYNELIKNFPDSPRLAESYLGKANVQYLLKDYKSAIETYQRVIEHFKKAPEDKEIVEKTYFGMAWAYLKSGDIDSAIKNFEKIMDQTQNKIVKVSALTQIGDAYQDAGNLQKALEVYDKILRNFPDSLYSDYVQFRQGITLLKMDKAEAAILALQTLRTNFPNSKFLTESKYYLGVAFFKKTDWARAKENIENFLKGSPKNSEYLTEANYVLALSLFNQDKAQEAMKVFEKILKDFPAEENLVRQCELGIAKCFYKLGDTQEAVKRFKAVIYKSPKTETALTALMWLGDYSLELPNFENAIRYYQQILKDYPGNNLTALTHYKLGQAFQGENQLDEAINEYKLIDDPNDKELYARAKLAVADIFSKELDAATAIETYESIAVHCPEMRRDAYLKIAEAYQAEKKFSKAQEALQNALASQIALSQLTDAELQFKLADNFELLNKSKEATDTYLKIAYLYPKESHWVTKAYLRVARIFEDQEDWENAQVIYEKIIKSGTEEVKYAQERLDGIKNK